MLSSLQESPDIVAAVSEEKTLSVYKLIVDGGLGGQIIIAILFILLAVSLYIYFERFFAIKAASKVDKNFMNQIKDYVSNGKLEAADALCKKTNSPTARLIEKGISRIGKPLDDINKAIENAGIRGLPIREKCKCDRYHSRSCTYDWFFRDSNRNDRCHS